MIAIPKFLSTPSRTRQWNFFARPISAGSERKNHGYEPPNRPFVAHPGRLWASGSIYPQDFPQRKTLSHLPASQLHPCPAGSRSEWARSAYPRPELRKALGLGNAEPEKISQSVQAFNRPRWVRRRQERSSSARSAVGRVAAGGATGAARGITSAARGAVLPPSILACILACVLAAVCAIA